MASTNEPLVATDGGTETTFSPAAKLAFAIAIDDLKVVSEAVESGLSASLAMIWKLPEEVVGPGASSRTRSLLMLAAHHGSVNVLGYLLEKSADVCFVDEDGSTALHIAAASGAPSSAATIALLLQYGASIDARNAKGQTPAEVFKRSVKATHTVDELLRSPTFSLLDRAEFKTDYFRMYCFKVVPCPLQATHDWTECCFAHPGEKANRRDPREYAYGCSACPDFRKGVCARGAACRNAHGVFECWLHPDRYRTQLCKDGPRCTRRLCFFAHTPEEFRQPKVEVQSPSAIGAGKASSEDGSGLPPSLTDAGLPLSASHSSLFKLPHFHSMLPSVHASESPAATERTSSSADLDNGWGQSLLQNNLLGS